VEAATFEVNRVAESLEQNALNLMRDVRLAYADWLLASERARLAEEAVDVRGQIVRLTNVRLRVGDVSDLEANAARFDQSLATEQATRFKRDMDIARDRLRLLLGMSEQSEAGIALKTELKPEVQHDATGAKLILQL
jgi:outer membrane protein, heavy metal efflux system